MLIKKCITMLLITIFALPVQASTSCTTGQKMADSGNNAAGKSMNSMNSFVIRTEDAFRDANTQCFGMLKQVSSIVPGADALPYPSLVGPIVTRVMGQVINNQFSQFCDKARLRGGDIMGKLNNVGNVVQDPSQVINNVVTPIAAVPSPISQMVDRVRSIFK